VTYLIPKYLIPKYLELVKQVALVAHRDDLELLVDYHRRNQPCVFCMDHAVHYSNVMCFLPGCNREWHG
jgi:hypothetical protein